METNDKIKIGLAIFVVIIVTIIIWRVLGKIGLVKSKEQKQKDSAVETLFTMTYFDPAYNKGKSFAPLGKSAADKYAKDLNRALGIFGDDEEAIYSTFGKLKNKTNISEVAESFQNIYKKDMRATVLGNLSEKEMKKLFDIISKLPNF